MQILKIVGIVLGGLLVLAIILGSMGPETHVVTGSELARKFTKQVRKMALVDEDEEIRLFYSDAFVDIKAGMYFVTDRKLVLYSNAWTNKKVIIPFEEIAEVSSDLDGSFFDDAVFWVRTKDGDEHKFPVSVEEGGAERFYDYLQRNTGVPDSAVSEIDDNELPEGALRPEDTATVPE
jgi:hypothetical protein